MDEDRIVRVGDLADLKRVADELGVSYGHLRVMRTRGQVASPLAEFDMGPVWDISDIRKVDSPS